MGKEKRNYTELGDYLDALAWRKRRVRGPYAVQSYMVRKLAEQCRAQGMSEEEIEAEVERRIPSGGVVWKVFHGETTRIDPRLLPEFAEAFELSQLERTEMAWISVYGFPSAARAA